MRDKKLTIEEVKHIAKLANLTLSEEEIVAFIDKLSQTLTYVDQLQELDTKDIEPTPQVTNKVNQFREDEIIPSLTQEEALKNAVKTHNGYFVSSIKWS